jgi:hypothetical protein
MLITQSTIQTGGNAVVCPYSARDVTWCTILTDGVDEPAASLGIPGYA